MSPEFISATIGLCRLTAEELKDLPLVPHNALEDQYSSAEMDDLINDFGLDKTFGQIDVHSDECSNVMYFLSDFSYTPMFDRVFVLIIYFLLLNPTSEHRYALLEGCGMYYANGAMHLEITSTVRASLVRGCALLIALYGENPKDPCISDLSAILSGNIG